MTYTTELNLSRDIAPGTTENITRILQAAHRPTTLQELLDAGAPRKPILEKALILMHLRGELDIDLAISGGVSYKFYSLPA